MDQNLVDDIGSYNGQFLQNGITANNPTFSMGASGYQLVLGYDEGIELPISLADQLDTMTSIELRLDFTITDLNELNVPNYKGRKQLVTLSNSHSLVSAGVILYAQKASNNSFDLYFSYSDGLIGQIPDHPGFDNIRIATFDVNEEVHVNAVLDFENLEWSVVANNEVAFGSILEIFDLSILKTSIKQNQPYIGWGKGLKNDLINRPEFYTSRAVLDNVQFFSPRSPINASILTLSLSAMINHINGTNILTQAELESHLNQIIRFYGLYKHEAQFEIYSFISTYESLHPPLFENRNLVLHTDLPVEAQVLLFIQQNIHDLDFVDGNLQNVEGVAFEAAEVFPGTVAPSAPRVTNALVEVNGSYSHIPGARQTYDFNPAKRPTGYYVAPGELVTITIPPHLVNKGLRVLVGAHDSDHSIFQEGKNRFNRISKEYDLDNESTTVANPFGGGIYILIGDGLDLGWFNIEIDGAVKAPYLSTRPGRASSLTDWMTDLASGHVHWVDMEAEKYMMTLPVAQVSGLSDPVALLDSLESIMDAYHYLGGRPLTRSRAEYFMIDSRLPRAGGYGTGYPQIIDYRSAPYAASPAGLIPTIIVQPDFHKSTFRTTLHEHGHGAKHPTLPLEYEANVHIPATYIYNQLYNMPVDTAFKYSSGEKMVMDEATMDWMLADNFRNNLPMDCDPSLSLDVCHEVRYQHRGHAKYVEMATCFGWESIHKMNEVFYHDWIITDQVNLLVDSDDMIANASAATGFNMAPLFHFWGLHPSPGLADQLSFLPKSDLIKDKLNHYKSIIPQTSSEFEQWKSILINNKGAFTQTRFDSYIFSSSFIDDIENQIDYLLATYFGENPCIDNLTLSNEIAPANYKAQYTIQASRQQYPNSSVTMGANQFIELQPGFECMQGSQLMIDPRGCP